MSNRFATHRVLTATIVLALLLLGGTLVVRGASPPIYLGAGTPDVYTLTVTRAQLAALELGRYDVATVGQTDGGALELALVLTPAERDGLLAQGVSPQLWRDADGRTATQRHTLAQEEGYDVYRPYDGPGNIREELETVAADHPELVELIEIGRSIEDRPIYALRVTEDAAETPDGSRPATLYSSLQHAREWISIEVNRRLLHHFVDGYGQDDAITALLGTRELWFVVVANPDGYQFTFEEARLWRKNKRDNDGDGVFDPQVDGVDLNRNFAGRWNYDNDGSSGFPGSGTYRGTAAASEPETQAMQGLMQQIEFNFVVNYHSAAELLLYPEGWQDETHTADDPIYQALSGDVFTPAIEGFLPMLSAGLYITNGETCDFAHSVVGSLCWTPELSTPPPGYEGSGFEFPDDEALIQAEFEKNLPFAMDVARSTDDPTRPSSHLGNTVEPLHVDAFPVSYGNPQPVQATVARDLGDVELVYQINDGPEQRVTATEWDGGQRYGDTGDVYFRRVRGVIDGAAPGDAVQVRFEAGDVASEPFRYQVVSDSDHRVLVLAAEDYTGIAPTYERQDGPSYLKVYTQALDELGIEADVYDVDANDRMAPSPLGVLSHYDVVIWYTGDDEAIRTPAMVDGTVSRTALELMLGVRDFMNEGGKLLFTGKHVGNPYLRGFEFDPVGDVPCDPSSGEDGCRDLANDFMQYYLGAEGPTSLDYVNGGTIELDSAPFEGLTLELGGPHATAADHAFGFRATAERLSPDEYPQFASQAVGSYHNVGIRPNSGEHFLYSGETNYEWQRVHRTIDLTDAAAADLRFWTARQTRQPFDALIVEAHTVGQDDWTTLPDENGHTTREDALSCWSDVWFTLFPPLVHYMTPDGNAEAGCRPEGTTGEWHAATGFSDGWEQWAIDLDAYAGREVEVSITYLSSRVAFTGVFLDDVAVLVDGEIASETSFEDGLGGWTVSGLPVREEESADFFIATVDDLPPIEEQPIVLTDDSVTLGFALESVADTDNRSELLRRALAHLGVEPPDTPPPSEPTIYLPQLMRDAEQ